MGMVPASMFGRGRKSGTFTFALGGTGSLLVTLDQTFAGDFMVLAQISKQTVATLGIGVVSIKEARRSSDNVAEVVLVSNQILSNVTVEVVAMGIGF